MSLATNAGAAANTRAEDRERLVAFAFSAAEMLVETNAAGVATYAAGAFRSRFGRPPEAFCGRAVQEMVAPVDREPVSAALAQMADRGRVAPFTIRLSDTDRTPVAFSGIALATPGRALRFCLSFSRLPAPAAGVLRAVAPSGLAHVAADCLRTGTTADLSLIEILCDASAPISGNAAVGEALERMAPNAIATEISPGRFGLISPGGLEASPRAMAETLDKVLRAEGIEAAVSTCHLPLAAEGLSAQQMVRALRQALTAFARNGPKGFNEAGFEGGIGGYLQRAATKAALLRAAISANRFSLAFQPVVRLNSRRWHHVEALIRPLPIAELPVEGPQGFVSLVESVGLAEELDLAVCRMACEAALRARQVVAVNLSGQSIQSPDFRQQIAALLQRSAAPRAGLMMIEMTETSEVDDMMEARQTTEMFRSLGVPFCLDDFGAGTTDVRMLRALAPDIVKLDGSYVPGVANAGRERAFVAGMVEIAHAAGAQTVAERIETEAEAEALLALGVELGQGWLFGRPGHLAAASQAAPAG